MILLLRIYNDDKRKMTWMAKQDLAEKNLQKSRTVHFLIFTQKDEVTSKLFESMNNMFY